MMSNLLQNMYFNLANKYSKEVRNQAWIWVIVLLVALYFAYGFYCTTRGYNFSGVAQIFRGSVRIGCYR